MLFASAACARRRLRLNGRPTGSRRAAGRRPPWASPRPSSTALDARSCDARPGQELVRAASSSVTIDRTQLATEPNGASLTDDKISSAQRHSSQVLAHLYASSSSSAGTQGNLTYAIYLADVRERQQSSISSLPSTVKVRSRGLQTHAAASSDRCAAHLVRRIELVLFDLDDTLHDDTHAYSSAAEEVAREIAAEHGIDALALKAAYIA